MEHSIGFLEAFFVMTTLKELIEQQAYSTACILQLRGIISDSAKHDVSLAVETAIENILIRSRRLEEIKKQEKETHDIPS